MSGLSGLSGLSGAPGVFGGAAAFSPADIAGLQLWLDANDISTLWIDSAGTNPVTADNDVIGKWDDKSINGNNAIQTTTAEKSTYKTGIQNGLPIARFDGIDDEMFANTLAAIHNGEDRPLSVFAIFKTTAALQRGALWAFQNNGDANPAFFQQETALTTTKHGMFRRDDGNASSTIPEYGVTDAINFHYSSIIFYGTSIDVYIDGVQLLSGLAMDQGNLTLDEFAIGSFFSAIFFKGDLGELFIYNSAISNANRLLAESYLSSKWGL